MRKLALFATVVCLICCYGMNAEGQTATGSRYVGQTKAKTNGNVHGTVGMNQLCQTQYGPTSHICTVDEFFQSAAFAKSSTGAPMMWIQPSFSECVYDAGLKEVTCRVAEVGRAAESAFDASCSHWTTSSTNSAGLVVVGNTSSTFPSGAVITSANCADNVSVACCAP